MNFQVENKKSKILSCLGFLMLVLLVTSPCPVRNSFQRLVGAQTTEVQNRSKSQLSQKPECVVATVKTYLSKNSPIVKKIEGFSGNLPECPRFFCQKQNVHLSYVLQKEQTDSSIPLYILYKRLKYMCLA